MPKRKQGEVDNQGVQDFELIELLIREKAEVIQPGPSTSAPKGNDFESFKARFQSYVDQVPSYLHSVGKEGFFPHFFLGSFSTLVDTEIATKLNIEKVYFSFDSAKTLKVAVIKKGEIKSPEDVADKVKLFVIAESGSTKKKFSYGELDKILGNTKVTRNEVVRRARDQGKLGVRLVEITREKDAKGRMVGISVDVKSNNLDKDTSAIHEFKEIKKGLWSNPESDIAKLTNPDVEKVEEPIENILKKVSKIHSEYGNSLTYAQGTREAAHHGFIAGALVNFRYRYNLRVYLEQFAGRGYADIVLVPRGKDRSLNAVPIIIELKAATKEELKELEKGGKVKDGSQTTPAIALEQAKDYAKGFQPNTMRVLTISDNVLCVGLNLDSTEGEKFLMHISPREDREIAPPTVQALLKEASDWNGRQDTITNVKEKIEQPLKRIYHTFPGTPEKGGNYFSRFMLGQLLLADKFVDIDLEKSVFLYNEYPLAASTRSGAQSTERPVTTFMLTKGNQGQDKEVFIFHIREGGKGEFSKKKIPINLPTVSKITEVYISLQEERKSDFFDVEKVNRYNSLNEYKQGKSFFGGEWKNIPYPAELKETFDAVLESQLASSQDRSQSIGKYKELFGKLGEAMLPFKVLIEREAHTQAVFHGAFSHYSDIKLGESQENRALVLTEFQTGRGKRIDMVVHGIKFADQASSAKEYDPVGLELKGPREGKTASALKDEANKQISDEYTKGVTYKTLTDGKEVDFVGVVFDKEGSNGKSLIQLSNEKEFTPVKVVHSSIFSISQQQCSKGRKTRNIGIDCIDSRDEEKITEEEKEKRIKELFDADKVVEKVKNIEFYDQLFKVSERISRGETIDQNVEEAFLAKVKGIDLNSIDPEIRDIVKEIKDNVENKEEMKNILRRSRVAEKVGKVAKGVGLTYREFLDDGKSESQNIINKINNSPEAIAHLNRVGEISGWAMQGMMYKNLIGDILSGNLEGVAINLGFIGSSNVLGKVANTVAIKGEEFISEGKLFLGKSLKAASPFLARAASAFIAYDLANQVKAFKSGDKNAMTGIVGDSIALTVDVAEIGIEIAEVAGMLSGVSSVTGPIGAGVTAIVFIGTDIYLSVKTVGQEDKIIHLTGWEKFKEGWRAFLHMKPEEYIEKLIEDKLANNHLVENAAGFLKQHTGIQRYVFPTGKLVDRQYIKVDLDNKVLLNEKVGNIKWSRARPDKSRDGELFCLPEGDWESVPKSGAYFCENAIGLSYPTNRTGNYTLIDLGRGNDEIIGFQDSPNIFLVGDGKKKLTGGNKDDVFILVGNGLSNLTTNIIHTDGGMVLNVSSDNFMHINGGRGNNTLDLAKFSLGNDLEVRFLPEQLYGFFNREFQGALENIQTILGRKKERDEVQCGSNLKYVDGRGGRDNSHPDRIVINQAAYTGKLKIAVRPNTEIENSALEGNFDYITFHGEGSANIYIKHQTDKLQHNFLFNYTLSELKKVEKNISYPIKDVKFSFQQTPSGVFDIDIKNVTSNVSYMLIEDKIEVKVGNKGSLYLLQDTNEPVNEIIKNYPAIANKLNATVVVKLQDELVVIGHGKHEVMSNDPLHRSHLTGSGGENVYVITPTQKEVSIYDVSEESSIDTLDLRNTVKDMKDIQFSSLKVSQDGNDLLIKLGMERSPLKFPIRLKNGVQWYQKLHVILNINMQLERNGNDWVLSPLPLIFDKDIKTIIITAKDIEEGNRLIVHKQAGQYTLFRLRDDLVIITDPSTEESNVCTILLSNFYREPKMETLSIEFNDTTISIQEKMNEINGSKLLFCSSALQVNKSFSIDSHQLLNNHDCLRFNSDKIAFFRSNDDLLLLSDQGVSVILGYYSRVHKWWNLPMKLNNSIMKPEEFREKADNTSSFRYYLPGEEGLQVYHNQPIDKHQVGLVDLKDKSILDCDMKIVDKNLILSSRSDTIVKVENWVTSQTAREMMFAFKDAIVSNSRCIFATCNQEDIIEEFNQEKSRVDKNDKPQTVRPASRVLLAVAVREDNLDSANTLHHAVVTNNYAVVQLLISKGADIEAKDNDGRTPLQCAVSLDKSDMVELLLNKGVDIEAKDNDGRTPLQCAVSLDKSDMVELLLNRGADIETKDYNGSTPLSRAVALGNLNMVQLLLNKGVYIYSKDGKGKTIFEIAYEYHKAEIVNYLITKEDEYGNTILHYAAEEGNLDLVGLLLDNNAHINIKNNDGWTPLHLAVKEDKLNAVKLFIERKANINAKDNNNQTPLHIAVQGGNLCVIRLIVNEAVSQRERLKSFINERDKFGYTPLQYAAKNGKWDIVNLFLDKTAERSPADIRGKDQFSASWTTVHYAVYNGDLNLVEDIFPFLSDKDTVMNVKDSNGWAPLHYAVYYNAFDVVRFLVNKGADIESGRKYNKTPLGLAIQKHYVDIVGFLRQTQLDKKLLTATESGDLSEVRRLVNQDANVNAKDMSIFGRKPIHIAAENNNKDIIELLLSKGVSVNDTDNNGRVPLYWASWNDNLDVVKYLIGKGASINAEDNDGKTPLGIAIDRKHSSVVEYLQQTQLSLDKQLLTAVGNGDFNKAEDLVGRGANLDAKDSGGWTLLHFASSNGHLGISEYLIDRGADINAKDNNGRTPLHCALWFNRLDMVKYLISEGANIDTKDKDGSTLLYSAAEAGDLDRIRFLLDNGANIETENGEYQATPLHGAVANYRLDVVKLLLNRGANVNAEDKDNWRPLHYAADTNSLDIVKVLVDAHANLGAKGNYSKTPLDIAKDKGHNNTVEYLEKKLREERGKPLQRKRRHHHHGSYDRYHGRLSCNLLAIDSSNQPEIAASSGTRASLWINNCISWGKKLAASTFSIIPALLSQYNSADKNNVKSDNKNIPQSTSSVGWNKFLNNENIALASCVADALDNTPSRRYQGLMSKGVEVVPSSRVAVEFALKNFNSFVEDKIRNLESKEQVRIRVELKDAYPEIIASLERGVEFSGNIGLDNVLEKSKKRFCTNVLQKDKVSTCLSEIGVTKLGGNLNR